MLEHVVVIDGLFDQTAVEDEGIDRRGGRVSEAEEWLAVDCAEDLAVYFNVRIGPDHLQVEHDAAELHCFDHVAQDVHDVLRLHSSKRPGKDDEIERLGFDLDLFPGSDLIGDALSELVRQ